MRIWAKFICLGLGSTAFGVGPTGLAVMPIADTLKHRELQFQATANGSEYKISKHYTYSQGVLVGLGDRSELGYDNDFLGTTVYNAKFILLDENTTRGFGALSIGTQNYQHGKGDWYVVGRYDARNFRLHYGLISTNVKVGMFGLDAPVGAGVFTAELASGREGLSSFSYAFDISAVPGLNLQLYYTRPFDHEGVASHGAVLSYGFRF